MKLILGLGESYAFAKNKPKQFKIRYTSLLAVLMIMCLQARAQVSVISEPVLSGISMDSIKPLQIGDTIPEYLWHHPLQTMDNKGNKGTVSLSAYRDRLLLIDFWATWCSPCISSLKKLEGLNANGDRPLAILPTTYETIEKVYPIFTKHQLNLPSVIDDKVLKHAFPHQIIPHVIWIYNNRLQAITSSHLVSDSAINHLIANGNITLPEKYERREETDINHLQKDNTENLFYQSRLTGYQHGLNNKHNKISISNGEVYITNKPIWNLFAQAARTKVTYGAQTIFELPDSLKLRLILPPNLSPIQRETWLRANTYCYHLNLPPNVINDGLPEIMFNELNKIFRLSHGVSAKVENRMTECYTLIRNDAGTKGMETTTNEPFLDIQPSGLRMLNHPISMLIATLAYRNRDLPLVDATGIEYPIDLQFEANLSDISSINSSLKQYGLEIVKQYYEIPVLVIFSI